MKLYKLYIIKNLARMFRTTCIMICGFAAFAINLYLAITALNAPWENRNIEDGIGLIVLCIIVFSTLIALLYGSLSDLLHTSSYNLAHESIDEHSCVVYINEILL